MVLNLHLNQSSCLSLPLSLFLSLSLSLSLSLQLAVIPEYNIFLGLSDSEVLFADLETFVILGHLPKSRGATYFAVDWQKLRGRVGFGRELRVGVATKKKLQLYEYKRNSFIITKVSQEGCGVQILHSRCLSLSLSLSPSIPPSSLPSLTLYLYMCTC